MRYYEKDGDEVDDFDEYDPTPYGGGYDLDLTYGRALAASGETCYAHCSSTGEIDYERPHFSSQAQPSAYSDEHLQAEYGSYAPHKIRPGHSHAGGAAKPGYGSAGKPHHSEEFGSGGYGGKPHHSEEFGSGYGRRPESEHGSGGYGGRKPNYGDESESPRRTGYRRNEEDHRERPSYQKRRDDDDDEGSRRKKYDSGDDEGSGRRKKYGGDDSDDDDDEKKHRRQRHQNKKHYDDDD